MKNRACFSYAPAATTNPIVPGCMLAGGGVGSEPCPLVTNASGPTCTEAGPRSEKGSLDLGRRDAFATVWRQRQSREPAGQFASAEACNSARFVTTK